MRTWLIVINKRGRISGRKRPRGRFMALDSRTGSRVVSKTSHLLGAAEGGAYIRPIRYRSPDSTRAWGAGPWHFPARIGSPFLPSHPHPLFARGFPRRHPMVSLIGHT